MFEGFDDACVDPDRQVDDRYREPRDPQPIEVRPAKAGVPGEFRGSAAANDDRDGAERHGGRYRVNPGHPRGDDIADESAVVPASAMPVAAAESRWSAYSATAASFSKAFPISVKCGSRAERFGRGPDEEARPEVHRHGQPDAEQHAKFRPMASGRDVHARSRTGHQDGETRGVEDEVERDCVAKRPPPPIDPGNEHADRR